MTTTGMGRLVQDQELQPGSSCTAERHGTRVAYDTYKCRCPEARAKSTRARKGRRARQIHGGQGLVPGVGTVRRLRALAAAGWSLTALAEHAGWTWQRLRNLRDGRTDHVLIATHRSVAALYARLEGTSGPSTRAAAYARAHGWLGPLWWDDDTIDDPSVDPQTPLFIDGPDNFSAQSGDLRVEGHPHHDIDPVAIDRALDPHQPFPTLNYGERRAAFALLLERGSSVTQAAGRLKLSGATARKWAEAVRSGADTHAMPDDAPQEATG